MEPATHLARPAIEPAGPGGAAIVHAGRNTSSHGLGVEQAVELARALGRLPRQLVVVGVEAAHFGTGPELTPAVAAAIEPAARLVVAMVKGRT
jgi:hydrogenase maturation protease